MARGGGESDINTWWVAMGSSLRASILYNLSMGGGRGEEAHTEMFCTKSCEVKYCFCTFTTIKHSVSEEGIEKNTK